MFFHHNPFPVLERSFRAENGIFIFRSIGVPGDCER
jgi:hypothetical protein